MIRTTQLILGGKESVTPNFCYSPLITAMFGPLKCVLAISEYGPRAKHSGSDLRYVVYADST